MRQGWRNVAMIMAGMALACVGGFAQAPVMEPQPGMVTSPPAVAGLPDWINRVDLSGQVFLDFMWNRSRSQDDYNAFDVSRAYFTVDSRVTDNTSASVTIDIARRMGGPLEPILKFANVQWADGIAPGTTAVVGMQPDVWTPFAESVWGLRFAQRTFAHGEGYLKDGVLGLGLKGALGQNMGEYHVAVVNGEGFDAPETGKYKDVEGRITFTPMAEADSAARGVFVSAFYSYGMWSREKVRSRGILMVGIETDAGTLAIEYFRAHDPKLAATGISARPLAGSASAWSAFGVLKLDQFRLPQGMSAYGRADFVDPDRRFAGNWHNRQILGLGYDVADGRLRFALDHTWEAYGKNAVVVGGSGPFFFVARNAPFVMLDRNVSIFAAHAGVYW